MKKHLTALLSLCFFSIFSLRSLFHPGLFTAHDIWHQVARLYHYNQAVSDGQFPPYWIADLANNLGYPLFFFSYHLPWITALPFLKLGVSYFDTIKILFFLSYLSSGILFYYLVFAILKNRTASFLGAFLYLCAPYRFLNIFVFGASGESFVFTFLPLLILGIYKLHERKNISGIIFVGLGVFGIVLSHLITFISLIPLLALFTISLLSKNISTSKTFLQNIILGGVLGISLSSFYLLPAFIYSSLTQVSTGAFSKIYEQNFLAFNNLLYSKWNFGTTNFSVQIGIAQWIIILAAFVLLIVRRGKLKQANMIFLIFISFWISIFMMLPISKTVWDFVAKFVVLDFPSMFLLPATLTAAFLATLLYYNSKKYLKPLLFISLILVALYTNRNYQQVNLYTNYSLSDYVGAEITTNSYNEYFPKNANLELLSTDQNYIVLPLSVNVSDVYRNSNKLSFKVIADKDQEISIKQLAFPGVNLYVNNIKKIYSTDSQGRIKTEINKGENYIKVIFEETDSIKIAKLVSILSLATIIFLGAKLYAKK